MIDTYIAAQIGNLINLQGGTQQIYLCVRNPQTGADQFLTYYVPRGRFYETKTESQNADGSTLIQSRSFCDINGQDLLMSSTPAPVVDNFIQDSKGVGWRIVGRESSFPGGLYKLEVQKFPGWHPIQVVR